MSAVAMEQGAAVAAVKSLRVVQEHAARVQNADPVVYKDGEFQVGDIHWQGDVGILRVEKVPEDFTPCEPVVQLAPGTSKGSRHLIEDGSKCKFYAAPSSASPLQGCAFEASGPTEITHPEHGNVTVPSGTYIIRYQRAYAEELRRLRD